MVILEKLGPNTLDHGLENTKSNSKSSTPHFTSKKALLSCKVSCEGFTQLLGFRWA